MNSLGQSLRPSRFLELSRAAKHKRDMASADRPRTAEEHEAVVVLMIERNARKRNIWTGADLPNKDAQDRLKSEYEEQELSDDGTDMGEDE